MENFFLVLTNKNLHRSVLDENLISLDLLRHGKAFAGAHVELPAVQFAFNYVIAKMACGQRCSLMRAKVFSGIEFAVDLEESELAPGWKFYRFAGPIRQILDSARVKCFTSLRRWLGVCVVSID